MSNIRTIVKMSNGSLFNAEETLLTSLETAYLSQKAYTGDGPSVLISVATL